MSAKDVVVSSVTTTTTTTTHSILEDQVEAWRVQAGVVYSVKEEVSVEAKGQGILEASAEEGNG